MGVVLKVKKVTFSKPFIIYINRPIRKKQMFFDFYLKYFWGIFFEIFVVVCIPVIYNEVKNRDFSCTKVSLFFKPRVQYANNVRTVKRTVQGQIFQEDKVIIWLLFIRSGTF